MARCLLLMRHGEVEGGSKGRFLGATDLPLSKEGRKQARAVAAQIEQMKPGVCYCSPLKRTLETARIVAPHIETKIEPDLCEVDFGEWEGKTFEEISKSSPEHVKRWTEFDGFAFPGGEAIGGFVDRIQRAVRKMAAEQSEVVLAVTHGGVIRMAMCQLLGLSPKNYLIFNVGSASLTTIDLFGDRGVLSGLYNLPQR